MGLLTDARTQAFMSRLVLGLHGPLEVLLYIAGVLGLVGLAFTPFNAGTYFSENALLPGLVERKYHRDQDVKDYTRDLIKLGSFGDGRSEIPSEWLMEQFVSLGLDVFTQNFTVKHPFTNPSNDSEVPAAISGTNVYAILRAPRIASTEAMVITVPYRNKEVENDKGRTHHGIGLMLSLANTFVRNTYWSKDIIFVVIDREEIGMQAWLEAYHDSHTPYIQSSLMLGRSGPIIAAINLELGSELTDHIDLKIEGLNGQLPNMDLFNLAVRLCRVEKVDVTFQNRPDPPRRLVMQWGGLKHSATTMLLNMAKQASGVPSGIHGLFLRYHIEALTLHAHPSKRGGAQLVSVGRVLEGVLRSVNNLLERFHQSFFFYVLPSCERYVSIGLYMIPFALLLLVPTIHGMALWLQSAQPVPSEPSEEKEKAANDATSEDKDNEDEKGAGKEEGNATKSGCDERRTRPFSQVMPLLIGAHIIGAMLFISPEYLVSDWIVKSFKIDPKGALCIGFLAFFMGTASLPVMGRKNSFRSGNDLPSDWQLLKCLTLLWYSVTLLAVSMFNFSLAFFVAVPTIPIAVAVRPTQWKILRLLQALLMIIISPLALLFTDITLNQLYFAPLEPISDILSQGLAKTIDILFDSVLNSYLFGNKSFVLFSIVWFPIWFLLWIVLFRKTNFSKA